MKNGVSVLFLGVLLVGLVACGIKPLTQETESGKLRGSTYIHDGPAVAIIVGTRPALFRRHDDYLPLEIAVVNKSFDALDLTPESFVITTEDGQRFPLAGRNELSRNYGNTDRERVFAEAEEAVAARYASYRRIPSNLTPGFDRPFQTERVSLPRFSYFYDYAYFSIADLGHDVQFVDLEIKTPQLEGSVTIRFPFPERKKD